MNIRTFKKNIFFTLTITPIVASAQFSFNTGIHSLYADRSCDSNSNESSCSVALGIEGIMAEAGVSKNPYIKLGKEPSLDPNTGQIHSDLEWVSSYGNLWYYFQIRGEPGTVARVSFIAPFSVAPHDVRVNPFSDLLTSRYSSSSITVSMYTNMSTEIPGTTLDASARASFSMTNYYTIYGLNQQYTTVEATSGDFMTRPVFNQEVPAFFDPNKPTGMVTGYFYGEAPVRIDQNGLGLGWVELNADTMNGNAYIDPYIQISKDYLNLYPESTLILDPAVGNEVILTSAVPEPESWMLLLAGMGLVGFAARRKQTD